MNLSRLELSRLHVACAEALGVSQGGVEGKGPRQRATFAELVGTDPYLFAEALEASCALQEELDRHPGPHRFLGRDLILALDSHDLARYAAQLIGARRDGSHWTTAEPGEGATTVKLPLDFWADYLAMKAEMARLKKKEADN